MDRQFVWADIRYRLNELEKSAPEGHQPIVEVFLTGREAPIVPSHIETNRDPEYPWVVLQVVSARRSADDYLVWVPESLIARVEIGYVPTSDRQPVGFSLGGEVAESRESSDETAQVKPPAFPITPREVAVERDT